MKRNFSGGRYGAVAADGAVDWDHPLNKGKTGWWVTPNGLPCAGNRLLDICSRNHATIVNNSTPNNWSSKNGFGTITCTGGSVIQIPDFTNLAAGDFTVRVIHKPNSWNGGYTALYDKGATREMSLFVGATGDISYAGVGTTSASIAISTGMTVDKWWDLVITRIGADLFFYVNGVFVNSNLGGFIGTTASAGTWNFGDNTASGGGTNYDGQYYSVEYWPFAISDNLIKSAYAQFLSNYQTVDSPLRWISTKTYSFLSAGATKKNRNKYMAVALDGAVDWDNPLNKGKVGWWYNAPGTACAGNRLVNLCGNYSHGILTGSATRNQGQQPYKTAVYTNNSSTDCYDCGSDTRTQPTSNGSITAWVFLPATTGNWGCLLSSANTTTDRDGFSLGKDSSNLWWCEICSGAGADIFSASPVPVGRWVRIGLSWNSGSSITLYEDGIALLSTPGTGVIASAGVNPLKIGTDGGSSFYDWPGYIEDVSLWNRTLSPAEFLQDYQYAKQNYMSEDSPLLWYEFGRDFVAGTSSAVAYILTAGQGSYVLTGQAVNFINIILNWEQEGFKWRYDNGTEITSPWIEAQDINVVAPLSTNIRLRNLINSTANQPTTQFELQYKKSTDTLYTKVLDGTPGTIASLGSMGTGTSSTSNSSYTFNTATTALSAGDTGILVAVSDNTSTGADGDNGEVTSVTGGTGVWTKLGEWTNTNGAAGSGVTTSVWAFYATAALATGTTITINYGSNRTDKTCSMWGFSNTSKRPITKLDTSAVGNSVDAAVGFGSAAFSGLASKQRLYFRGLGKEANSTTDITVSTSFTRITLQRSRNNAAAVCVRGEFRINTSTGETSNPTMAVSGNTAGVFLALVEQPQPIIYSNSTNIAAGGEATTAQLIPPSGKTTSVFTAGKASDDVNPAATVDVQVNGYTEMEWCLQAVSGVAATGDIYQFRIYKSGGTALDTYTVTGQWTIGQFYPYQVLINRNMAAATSTVRGQLMRR